MRAARRFAAVALAAWPALGAAASEVGDVGGGANPVAIGVFVVFVISALGLAVLASRRIRSSGEFLDAGGRVTALQNGAAIAGDFISAASFLGLTGLIFIGGVDGLLLALGLIAAWPLMLILISDRIKRLGRFTATDVISYRLREKPVRIIVALGALGTICFYLIAQMVGAGKLVELLFGIPYKITLVMISVLVMVCIAFGGMLAATWIQMIKAGLLLGGATLMTLLVMLRFDFNFSAMLQQAVEGHRLAEDLLRPGALFSDPLQIMTLAVTLCFGILGLPHILMRLYTVPTPQAARRSALYATVLMGYFYVLTMFLGFGTVAILLGTPDLAGALRVGAGGNMAVIQLSAVVGGPWLLGFMSAVAFATIVAVITGLSVGAAAAVSHDLYGRVLCSGNPDPDRALLLSRVTVLGIGVIGILAGLAFEHENIASITILANVTACGVIFPLLFMAMSWRGLTTRGALGGGIVGLATSLALILTGPSFWTKVLGFEAPLFPYDYPGLFAMAAALAAIWLFSVTDSSPRAAVDRKLYDKQRLAQEFGEPAAE